MTDHNELCWDVDGNLLDLLPEDGVYHVYRQEQRNAEYRGHYGRPVQLPREDELRKPLNPLNKPK